MNRREVLQRTALALGYAVSAPLASAVLNGCRPRPDVGFEPKFFNEHQAQILCSIVNTILPKTDTPGAVEAGVPGFIDDIVGTVYSAEQQKRFIDGLAALEDQAKTEISDDFMDATPEQQLYFIRKVNTDLLSAANTNQSEGWWLAGSGKGKPFFLELKELTLLGFFTSEPGASQVLRYEAVPGPFKGCVPLSEVGKTWAT